MFSSLIFTMYPYFADNLVFVTASSDEHFNESKDAVASVQFYFPHKHILYYDLGLEPKQVDEVWYLDIYIQLYLFSDICRGVHNVKVPFINRLIEIDKYDWKC